MKKNLFEIKTEEVQRILSLHEERSKNQYLNIISEQETQKYTLTSKEYILENVGFGSNDLKLFQGATFTKQDNVVISKTGYQFVDFTGTPMREPEVLINLSGGAALQDENQVTNGTVTYYCSGPSAGKFNTDAYPASLFYDVNKVLTIQLDQLCGGRVGNFTQQKSGSFTANNVKDLKIKYGENKAFASPGSFVNYNNNKASVLNNLKTGYINFTCPSNFTFSSLSNQNDVQDAFALDSYTLTFFQDNFCTTKQKEVKKTQSPPEKSKFTALYTIKYNHDLGKNYQILPGDTIIKSTKYPDYAAVMRVNTPKAYFNCKTNTWNDNINCIDTKGALTKTIISTVCPQILSPTNVSADTTTNSSTNTTTQQTATTQPVNRRQQFVQKTVAGINNVQKALGVSQPNGQLKNSDIDNIISKLQ